MDSVKFGKKAFPVEEKDGQRVLDLSGAKIYDLEYLEGLAEIPRLHVLDLSKNELREIDALASFPCLTCLRELDLSHNHITHIKGLEGLRDLRRLDLSKNSIIRIEGLADLEHLRELNLRDNLVREIQGLEHLQRLEALDLKKNPLCKADKRLLKQFDGIAQALVNHCHHQRYVAQPQLDRYGRPKGVTRKVSPTPKIA